MFNSSVDSSSTTAVINFNLQDGNETFKDKVLSIRSLFVVLFFVYCGSLAGLFSISPQMEPPYFIFYLVSFGFQRLPVLVLALYIVFDFPKNSIEGPKTSSRVILLIASMLDTINNIPIPLWAVIIKDRFCTFSVLGKIDIIHMMFVVAQILFFVFLREEFIRNKEQFLYNTVQTRKEYQEYGIDWRHFHDAPPKPEQS